MSQIEFKEVTKKYEDVVALDKVTFQIDRGEFVFLIGPSGAGKSTLIKLLIREDVPTSGEVLFDNINVSLVEKKAIPELRRRIGVVFQDFKLLDSKTVFENVAIATEVVGCPDDVKCELVPNVLNMVGLLGKKDRFPYQLSGGEKQRVSIARALAHEPDVLIADEATGMIDPQSSSEIMEILERINLLGTTVLMATHNDAIVNKLKKRVVKMDKGAIKSDKRGATYDE